MKGVMDLSTLYRSLWMLPFFYSIYTEKIPVVIPYEEGQSIRLDCTVRTVPEAIWQKEGRPITIGNRVISDEIRISVGGEGANDYRLKIKGMLRSHKGNYTCKDKTTNEFYELYTLRLRAKASISYTSFSGPTVRTMENETVFLWCNASGDPVLSVSWYVIETDSLQEEKITGLGINGNMLGIRRVSRNCASKFQCQAVSTYKPEEIAKRNITLIVEFFPEISINGFINKKSSRNFLIGDIAENVKLSCTVFSSIHFNVTWLRDDKLIGWYSSLTGKTETKSSERQVYSLVSNINQNEKRIVEVVLTFTLDTDDTYSNYSCTAENKVGSNLKTIETKRKDKR